MKKVIPLLLALLLLGGCAREAVQQIPERNLEETAFQTVPISLPEVEEDGGYEFYDSESKVVLFSTLSHYQDVEMGVKDINTDLYRFDTDTQEVSWLFRFEPDMLCFDACYIPEEDSVVFLQMAANNSPVLEQEYELIKYHDGMLEVISTGMATIYSPMDIAHIEGAIALSFSGDRWSEYGVRVMDTDGALLYEIDYGAVEGAEYSSDAIAANGDRFIYSHREQGQTTFCMFDKEGEQARIVIDPNVTLFTHAFSDMGLLIGYTTPGEAGRKLNTYELYDRDGALILREENARNRFQWLRSGGDFFLSTYQADYDSGSCYCTYYEGKLMFQREESATGVGYFSAQNGVVAYDWSHKTAEYIF